MGQYGWPPLATAGLLVYISISSKGHKAINMLLNDTVYRVVQKADPLVYFDDNFGKYGPILTIFSPLKQEIYEAQKLCHFSA